MTSTSEATDVDAPNEWLANALIHSLRDIGISPGRVGSSVQFRLAADKLIDSGVVIVNVDAAKANHDRHVEQVHGRV